MRKKEKKEKKKNKEGVETHVERTVPPHKSGPRGGLFLLLFLIFFFFKGGGNQCQGVYIHYSTAQTGTDKQRPA